MAPSGKKARRFFSAFSRDSTQRSEVTPSSSRPQTAHGSSSTQDPLATSDYHQTQRAGSLEELPQASALQGSTLGVDKPLPSTPVETHASGSTSSKFSFANRKFLGRHDKFKSKSVAKLSISGPFDPKKAVNPSMNPFQDHEHAWQAMEANQPKQPVVEEPATTEQQSLPRSTSNLSFSNVFKLGSHKKKDSNGRAKSPNSTSQDEQHSAGKDDAGSRTLAISAFRDDPSSAGSSTPVASSSVPLFDTSTMRRRKLRDDLDARKAIGGSPKLQKFFYGTSLLDEASSSQTSADISLGSPARKRPAHRPMASSSAIQLHESHSDNDDALITQRWAWRDIKEPSTTRTPYGTGLSRYYSSPALDQPSIKFQDMMKTNTKTQKESSEKLAPKPVTPEPHPYMVPAEQYNANKKFDEGVSGLTQHPNVMECVEPPEWYKETVSKGLQLSEPAKPFPDDFAFQPTTRYADRRMSRYIKPGEETAAFSPNPPPEPSRPIEYARERHLPSYYLGGASSAMTSDMEATEVGGLSTKNKGKGRKHSVIDEETMVEDPNEDQLDDGKKSHGHEHRNHHEKESQKVLVGEEGKPAQEQSEEHHVEFFGTFPADIGFGNLDWTDALGIFASQESLSDKAAAIGTLEPSSTMAEATSQEHAASSGDHHGAKEEEVERIGSDSEITHGATSQEYAASSGDHHGATEEEEAERHGNDSEIEHGATSHEHAGSSGDNLEANEEEVEGDGSDSEIEYGEDEEIELGTATVVTFNGRWVRPGEVRLVTIPPRRRDL